MILPGSASLILSVANQLIKLRGRIDNLLAEKTAVQSPLVLGMPAVRIDDIVKQKKLVTDTLARTAQDKPDAFGKDRSIFQAQLAKSPVDPIFDQIFRRYFPDATAFDLVNPDALYLAKLQKAFPGLDWKDPATRIAAFAVAAGPDSREVPYSARVALSVADTLLEFGAENAASVVHDEKTGRVLTLVLQRLAEPEWDQFENWNPLLQSALRAVLNAALDVGEELPADNPWLAGVLDALIEARQNAAAPDDFVLGLVRGEGFPQLLAQGLLVAGNRLASDRADGFKQVAADVLAKGAEFIQAPGARAGFRSFFSDHWGDLLRAGLTSLDTHGDTLLEGADPLLKKILPAVVGQLAATSDADFLTHETLFRLANTTIGIVADNPGEIAGLDNKDWLRDLVTQTAATARELTVQKLFTPAGAEALVLDAVGAFARHPQLIIGREGLPLTIVTDVLTAVGNLKRLDRREVGETAIRAALGAIASDPSLAQEKFGGMVTALTRELSAMVGPQKFSSAQVSALLATAIETAARDPSLDVGKFGPVVTAVATRLASSVQAGKYGPAPAAELASAALAAVARNPTLFAGGQKDIAGAVLAAVERTLPNTAGQPWLGRMLGPLARGALLAVSRAGAAQAGASTAADFEKLVADVLEGGLKTAAQELGRTVDLEDIPPVVAGLLEQALRNELKANAAPAELATAFRALATARLLARA